MTRDETVALFLECEAKRAEARAAALAVGKDTVGADNAAHEAAKTHWNAWAEPLLAECKAMKADERWAVKKGRRTLARLEPKNAETQAWMEKADADFSGCFFLLRGVEGNKGAAGEDKAGIPGMGRVLNQSSLRERSSVSTVSFFRESPISYSAAFSGNAAFEKAAFSASADFRTPPSVASPVSYTPPSVASPISVMPPSAATPIS